MKPIGIYRDDKEAMMGKFWANWDLGFLMTTESQDLGLMSHPKDGALRQYSIPITILGH